MRSLYRGDLHHWDVRGFPLDLLARESALGFLETAARSFHESGEVDTVPLGEERSKPRYSLAEEALGSFVIPRRDVVEPDGNVDERLEKLAVFSLGFRPRLLEEVVALEVQLLIEELSGAKKKVVFDHPRSVS